MKKVFALLFLLPLFAVCQNPTVVSYSRFFPKNDKIIEFQKALKNHAAKYHTGPWKWRVYDIESGPDAGGVLTIEGPATWDQMDKRANISEEHTNDLYKNLLPLTTEKNMQGFMVFREDLSSVKLTDYSDKISISHVFPKPGKMSVIEDNIKLLKKVWEAGQQSIAVYETNSSGPVQFMIVTRYKQGLKEKEIDFRKPLKERYNAINGEGSFDKYVSAVSETLEHQWAELAVYNPDLSSK
jgi:hypothetical protein